MTPELMDPWETHDSTGGLRMPLWRAGAVVVAPCAGFAVGVARGEVDLEVLGTVAAMAVLVSVALLVRPPSRPGASWVVAALPVVMAAVGAAMPGRGPVLVVLWGAMLADVAVGGWWTDRSPLTYSEPLMPLAVAPVVAAGFMAAAGRPTAALVALGTALAVLLIASRWVVGSRKVSGLVNRLIAAVVQALGIVVVFGLAVPMLYLPGALSRLLHRSRPGSRSPSAGWTAVEVPRSTVVRDSARMFASTPDAVRRHRLYTSIGVVGLLAMVILTTGDANGFGYGSRSSFVDGGSGGVTREADQRIERLGLRYRERPAYRGVAFADHLQSEQQEFIEEHLVFDPTVGYVSGDFNGRYTETRDGARRTRAEPRCDCRRVRLWLLGGSAAFGMGQRDDHTIASELVQLAAADGFALEVVNYAVPGWVIDQEVAMTERHLDSSEPPPDLVVFYDGYNDAFLETVSSVIGGPVAGRFSELDQGAYDHFRASVRKGGGVFARAVESAGGAESIGENAARRYLHSRDLARTALGARGVESRFFMQTDAMVVPRHRDDGMLAEPALADAADGDTWATLLESMDQALRTAGVTSLRQVATEAQEPIFLDSVHTNELGARAVARALYSAIRADLDRLKPVTDGAKPESGS